MSLLNLNLPVIGDANATEDPKIRTALSDIQTVVNSLDNTNIASNADINGAKLLDASVAAAKLTTDSVETAKIVNDAVTNDKIGDDAVDTAQIADDAVENAQIADDAVDTAQIADGAVETAQINNDAVTAEKLSLNYGHTALNANTGMNNTQWNNILQLNFGLAGVYFVVASGGLDLEGTAHIAVSTNTANDHSPGLYLPAEIQPFARQLIAYSSNGVITFKVYPYSGKNFAAAGSTLTALRIGTTNVSGVA